MNIFEQASRDDRDPYVSQFQQLLHCPRGNGDPRPLCGRSGRVAQDTNRVNCPDCQQMA